MISFIFSFVPLVFLAAVGWSLTRMFASATRRTDPSVLARQLALYGLLVVTLLITAFGASWLVSLAGTRTFDNTDVAEALALVAIGVPAFTVLLFVATRRLGQSEERESGVWFLYFNLAALITLIGACVVGVEVVEAWVHPRRGVEGSGLVQLAIWLSLWALHWVYLRPRFEVPGDLHHAVGTTVGLVPMGIGQAGLTYVALQELYSNAFGRGSIDVPAQASVWIGLFIVGALCWITVWLRSYESAPRTTSWYVTVLPIGTLVGVTACVVSLARMLYLTAVWFAGDPRATEAAVHFDELPALVGAGSAGAISWAYHRALLGEQIERNNVFRTYDYLLLFASVVGVALGLVILVAALFDPGDSRNLAFTGATFALTGLVLGLDRGHRVHVHRHGPDGIAEVYSTVRRTYFYAVFGIGALVLLGSGVSALQAVFEAILDERLSMDTLVDHREQFATLVIVGAVLAGHAWVALEDRRDDSRPESDDVLVLDSDAAMVLPFQS